MTQQSKYYGFGFNPEVTEIHFLVEIPPGENGKITIYERFRWNEGTKQLINPQKDKTKIILSRHKWNRIAGTLQREFNNRLSKEGISRGKWNAVQVPVEKLLGKELLLLAWAIEDADPTLIPVAIRNWLGLSPEERWWLFTMTNATSGGVNDKRGWRKAIRYALTENPVDNVNMDNIRIELTAERAKSRKVLKKRTDDSESDQMDIFGS
jgi:hypothetical protein